MDYQNQPPPSSDPSPSPSDRPPGITSPETPSNNQNHEIEDIMACVTALEAALLPCLPARELQAIDRSPQPSHQIDVERHARDFMEAAKKLQLYFMGLKREDNTPTRAQSLKKEIAAMEEELKTKDELIKKHTKLIQESHKLVKEQIEKHRVELEKTNVGLLSAKSHHLQVGVSKWVLTHGLPEPARTFNGICLI